MESILNVKFDAVMTYDDWIIFKYKGKYYVADEEGIFEVELKHKMPLRYYEGDDIDLKYDYCGQSDDMKYTLGFDRSIDWKARYEELDQYVKDTYDDYN